MVPLRRLELLTSPLPKERKLPSVLQRRKLSPFASRLFWERRLTQDVERPRNPSPSRAISRRNQIRIAVSTTLEFGAPYLDLNR